MPRQSSDDDRPMGLKFTRNNFFSFSKGEVKRTPSSAKRYEEKESSNRDSDASFTQLSPIASPTIPTRSPFRIRDSQASAQNMSQSNNSQYNMHQNNNHHYNNNAQNTSSSSSNYNNSNYSNNNYNKNNSNSNNKNIITSSSHVKEPSTYSISSDSSSVSTDDDLTHELESIWKLKSSKATSSQEIQKKAFSSDDMLMQLLVSHAVVDSRDFKVLSFEEFEELKQNYARLKNQVQVSTSKLQLDKKIQETSHTLTQLSSPTHHYRESVLILRDEALEADKQVASLSERLNQLKEEEAQAQYKILQHTAGVLALGLHKLEKQKNNSQGGHQHHYVVKQEEETGHVDQEQVDRLKSELQQMTHSLNALLKRHNLDEQESSAELVLDRIEDRLDAYKADTKQLEKKVEAAEERIRLESMAGKKMEIQLKAIQDKRDAAEQRIHDLQSEIELLKEEATAKSNSNNKFDMDLESLQADMNNLNFEDDSNNNQKITDLESELEATVDHLHRVQAELKSGQTELGTLKIMISDLEVASSKAQSQATVYQNREKALKVEMEQYRDEVFGLRAEKEKWEKTMKRQTYMQMMDNSGPSLTEKFEQQLEEQEQEYRAQLKEQAAFLDKTSRQCESLQQEHDKLTATCQDLEDLIRDKTRALDARDVQITRLEQEMKQQQQQRPSTVDGATARNMKELQDAFSVKEAQWIEQSAAMEANFEGIMREFDRLTGTAMEFETDKMNYERRIEALSSQVKTLETDLNEEKVKNLGFQGDTPTTASLRREFRKMINDIKADHERVLEREADEKKKLEKQLKDLKHEKEMSRYERVNIGVQTLFIA
ncbi:hypothetical protein K501DRAFT_327681 [Backusella circina FSU 941]|nr:hypothetical protein K501DRAFT_327681 [Backusella circina FSU 941]